MKYGKFFVGEKLNFRLYLPTYQREKKVMTYNFTGTGLLQTYR